MVDDLEQQIESLTLANTSPNHVKHLEQTIKTQRQEIRRLSETIANKSKELFEIHQFNQRLQLKIRELEQVLVSDEPITIKLDSHNSSLPPSSDLPWQKIKRTRSLRQQSGLHVGGRLGYRGFTLQQVTSPDLVIVHQVNDCENCQLSLINIESIGFNKRQIFEIENGRLTIIEHRTEVKLCPSCRRISKGHFPEHMKTPVQYGTSVLLELSISTSINYFLLLVPPKR